MKLTNETVEQVEKQTWETGDYFVRKGLGGTGGGLRRLVRIERNYVVIAIDTYQTMSYNDASSPNEAMADYIQRNGEVAKVFINEIIFEEATQ